MPRAWRVQYAISGNDVIEFVNNDWDTFAIQNSGAAVVASNILGRSIWDFMVDAHTCEFYRMLFDLVRGGKGPVEFGFRCDSDTERRFLRMKMTCAMDRRIDFSVTPIASEKCRVSMVASNDAKHLGEMVTVCSWCKRVRSPDGSWQEIEDAMPSIRPFTGNRVPHITHGMCENCLAVETKVLEEHTKNDGQLISFGRIEGTADGE